MAEAAVEERPITRFFCHKCSVEFDTASPDYTCPHCAGGFIEELESNQETQDDDISEEDFESSIQSLGELTDLSDWLTFTNVSGAGRVDSPVGARARRDGSRNRSVDPPRRRRYGGHRIVRPRGPSRLGGGAVRPSFENLIADVVLNLTGQSIWGGAGGGNNPMFIVGNPGDYAWGREGLDAIVTQLLNQMDGTGPPPMPKDKIHELPVVAVNDEQVAAKLQCSVCWEDFKLGENVRCLPCQHVYHEACICPWLELHATCPICRKSLTDEANESASNNDNMTGLAALFRASRGSSTDTSSNSEGAGPSTITPMLASWTSPRSQSEPPREARRTRQSIPEYHMDVDLDMEFDLEYD